MMKLMFGDCLKRMKEIPDKSIDMILCDLPYGTTACNWDTVIPFDKLWEQYNRIIKPKHCIALFGSEPFSSYLRMSNITQFKYDWVWKKNAGSNFATVKYQPMKEHEQISIFNASSYYPQMQERAENGKAMIRSGINSKASLGSDVYSGANKGYNNSKQDPIMRVPSSVQYFNRERGLHPTQKPVALCEYLIKTYTLEGETVLDNCMGSGSTGVACTNTKRNFIGIELEEDYFQVAHDRIYITEITFESDLETMLKDQKERRAKLKWSAKNA